MGLLLDELLDTDRYHAFLAVRSIIRHDDDLVGRLANLVLKNDEVFRATSHHREHTVACSLQRLDNRQHRCNTQSTTCTNHSAVVLDVRWIAQRSYDISHIVANVQGTEFLRRQSYHLDNQRDSALVNVCTSNGQWHTFTFLVDTYNDEVASLAALGNQRSFHLEEKYLLRELLLLDNLIHIRLV